MRVLKDIPIIAFTFWCARLLASLMCRHSQNVALVKILSNYMHGKVINKNNSSPCFGTW